MMGCTGTCTYIAAYIVFHWPMTQSLSSLLSDMWLTLWSPIPLTVSNLRKRWPTNTPLCTWIMYTIMLLYTYICDHYKHISAIHRSCVYPTFTPVVELQIIHCDTHLLWRLQLALVCVCTHAVVVLLTIQACLVGSCGTLCTWTGSCSLDNELLCQSIDSTIIL